MKTKRVNNSIIINNVPFAKIIIDDKLYELIIEFDDTFEARRKVIFHSYYAYRMVWEECSTNDFIDENMEIGTYKRYILEVIDSDWIKELKRVMNEKACEDFIFDQARHFIFDMRDYIIEVVASEVEII